MSWGQYLASGIPNAVQTVCPTQIIPVIVVGAGLSGIGAARHLASNGLRPVVLEAKEKIGGRISCFHLEQNLSQNGNDGNFVVVQMGANWIHCTDDKNPIFAYAKKMAIELHETSSDDYPGDDVLLFDKSESVEQVDSGFLKIIFERYNWIQEKVENVSKQSSNTLQTIFDQAISESDALFGSRSTKQNRVINWLLDRVAIDLGGPLHMHHLKSYVDGEKDGEFGEAIVCGKGYSAIVDQMASELDLDIRFDHVVDHIQSSDEGVAVHCTNGMLLLARSCIVTLPLGVLQANAVHFAPSIPPAIATAMTRFSPGVMELVWLWYPFRFWPEGYNYFGITRDPACDPVFSTFLVAPLKDKEGNKQPILMCQVVGSFCATMSMMDEKGIAAIATETLQCMFGDGVPAAVGCARSSWASDPFARGSWAYISPANVPLIAAPAPEQEQEQTQKLERILYAGEAVSETYRGTAHGAYLSGKSSLTRLQLPQH